MNRFPSLAILALAFLAACDKDLRAPTTPQVDPGQVAKSISDGAHSGNPNFFFLVPSLPPSSSLSSFKLGTFNPNLAPEVVICQLTVAAGGFPTDASPCVQPPTADLAFPTDVHVVITPATTFESGMQKSYSLPADGFYYATWKTKGLNLGSGKFYRIQVRVGSVQLGFVDVTPEPIGTGLFQLVKVVTHEVVPTLQDGTIPIVFRIQNGATCYPVSSCVEKTVSNTGTDQLNGIKGTLVSAPNTDGNDGAKAFFPTGFLNGVTDAAGNPITQIVVTVKKVTPTIAQDCHNPANNPQLLQFLNCYNFSASPNPATPWGIPVTVSTCPDLPSTSTIGDLTQLWASDNGGVARPLAPTTMPMLCTHGSFDQGRIGFFRSSNPLLRLAASALGAVSRVFGPRPLYAWDVGVGGFDAGPGFSDIGWAMQPSIAAQAAATASVTSIVPVTATVTTDHDLGSESVERNHPVAGLQVYFSTGGTSTLSANANGAGAGSIATVSTNSDGVAVAYLTVAAGANVVTASIKDPAGTNVIVSSSATTSGQILGSIAGTVRDAAGAVVAAANVTVTNDETEQSYNALTNADGHYTVNNLPPGSYAVSALAGNITIAQDGVVVSGGPVTVDLTAAATGGDDIVVINDINVFMESMASPNNQRLVRNLVTFTNAAPRGSGTKVLFDQASDGLCNTRDATGALTYTCGQPGALDAFRQALIAGTISTIVDVSSGPEASPLTNIPPDVKVVVLLAPLQSYTANEINSLRAFALAGGRIVFIGEYTAGVYTDGVTAENNLLQQLGNFIQANTGSLLLSGNNSAVPQSAIQSSSITAGLTGLLFGGAGALTLTAGSPAAPLVIYNEQVLIAVAAVPGT